MSEEQKYIQLAEATDPKLFGSRIKIKCVVAGKDLAPYIVPEKFCFKCLKKSGFMKKCSICVCYNNVINRDEEIRTLLEAEKLEKMITLDFTSSHDVIASIIGVNKFQMEKTLIDNFSPVNCQYLSILIDSTQNVEDVNIIPEIDFKNFESEYVVRQALVRGRNIKTNNVYNLFGKVIPSPKNQQAIHYIDEAEQTTDNISNFELTPEVMKQLSIFRPRRSINETLSDIYSDFTNNVTKIYKRHDLLLSLDLVYHSALHFDFLGSTLHKGWIEALVLGDTRTGKSVTAEALARHYKMGQMVSAENMSIAGLLAGLQQTNKRWTLMWGKIPLNDRRLLIIDEASGLENEDFAKLSSVRSSGIAEINKIESVKTFARTRIIWISNPRHRKLAQYNYGILAVQELFGKQEDIARLDYAITISLEDMDSEIINMRHDEKVPHKYTSDLCSLLVRFAWSRKKEDILVLKETEDEILKLSKIMSDKYSPAVPIINSAEIRIKLAKMAVSLAIRLFNVDPDSKKVIVEPRHAHYCSQFLDMLYSRDSMGYDLFSEQRKKENELADTDFLEQNVKEPDQFNILLDSSRINVSDLMDIFEGDKKEVKVILGQLVRCRAMKKKFSYYVKTPAFIKWLKQNRKKPAGTQNNDSDIPF